MRSLNTTDDLIEAVRAADKRAIARCISLVEDGAANAPEILKLLFPYTGDAQTIGVTGSPGAGKSTLVDGLVGAARGEDLTVGVIAVDPTSPFSGGALLGDRVRMQSHVLDANVFIRSMATRGHLGGLSIAAPQATRVLEAAGADVVFLETVGVGQSEVEVAGQADTTVVVLAPGMGDAIQAAKAGILEIADIYCVNKADYEAARTTARDLRQSMDMGAPRDPAWKPPILRTIATDGTGIPELWSAIREHQAHLVAAGGLDERRRRRLGAEVRAIAGERLRAYIETAADYEGLVDAVVERRLDPYAAAAKLVCALGI